MAAARDWRPVRQATARVIMCATERELLAAGWQRCFVADEPRLSEAVETYEELGFEVRLLPVALDEDGGCTECMRQQPERFKVIYTRRRRDEGERGR